MKLPSQPSRSGESPDDPRVQKALEIAKSYRPSEKRMQRALTRFEESRASGTGPVTALGSRDGRGFLSMKTFVVLAGVVLGVGGGWTLHRWNHDAEAVSTATAEPSMLAESVAAAPVAPERPELDERSAEPRALRVDELPTANAAPIPAPTTHPPASVVLANGAEKSASRASSLAVAPDKTSAHAPTDAPSVATARAASFDEELALVEAARTSLANGATADCLAQLDEYGRRVRGGVFEREVAVIRIEALIARGDSARARSLGEAFLAKSPDSPYANRIRSLLARIPASTTKTP